MTSLAIADRTINVPFHGASLYVVNHNGEPYTPMKPIVEGMGMDWMGQYTKLKQRFSSTIEEISMVAADGKTRKMICLALRKLAGWLNTISPNKVRPEIRDRVIQYQDECDDVLYEYWTKGQVVNPRKAVKTQPGKITADQQFAIKELVMSRGQALPKEKQAKAIITMWSSLKSHFGISYKEIDADQFNEAISLVARLPLEGELITASEVSQTDEQISSEMLAAIMAAIRSQKQSYCYPLKPAYQDHIHSPDGLRELAKSSMVMKLLRELDADGHDVSGAAAEVTAMLSYIVGIGAVLRDIETHAQYVMAKAKGY
ncbi:TPA: phage antirepressor N-terminal domain-containing protein [Klebsiella pneumoniae]|nr:phage antirepressor N-terminal domain-containing protein [Klebsiella pneumoniae]HDU9997347.1 phage antirepressor N-terminal domain-containing protein [Klebsiella pneumoniae]